MAQNSSTVENPPNRVIASVHECAPFSPPTLNVGMPYEITSVAPGSAEGVKADGSFMMHGPQCVARGGGSSASGAAGCGWANVRLEGGGGGVALIYTILSHASLSKNACARVLTRVSRELTHSPTRTNAKHLCVYFSKFILPVRLYNGGYGMVSIPHARRCNQKAQ